MFNQKMKARTRLGLCVLFSIVAIIGAFENWYVLSGWSFAVALYYLHLNTEHTPEEFEDQNS